MKLRCKIEIGQGLFHKLETLIQKLFKMMRLLCLMIFLCLTYHMIKRIQSLRRETYLQTNAFVHTIRQYAIINEFETRIEHSDKERYMARCADKDCDWRVFAKKLHGGNTFMVIILWVLFFFLFNLYIASHSQFYIGEIHSFY